MKRVVIFLLFISSLLCLTGCMKEYEDMVPSDEELAEWDGNYIYRGNIRTKTTGEDTETLVNEIEYEGKTYNIVEVIDYHYLNNEIYMIAKLSIRNESNEIVSTVLYKYSPKEKEVEVIYLSNNLQSFFYVTSDYLVLRKQNPQVDGFVKINLFNNEATDIPGAYNFWLLEDYLILNTGGYLKYTKLDDIEFRSITKTLDYNYSLKIFESNGRKYLRILMSQFIAPFVFINGLDYFDLENDILYNAWSIHEQKSLKMIGDTYFVVGDTKGYDYVSSITSFNSRRKVILTEYLITNSNLYQVGFDNISIDVKEIYTFDQDTDFTTGYIRDDGKIVFSAEWVKKGSQLFPGGVKSQTYLFDPNTKKLTIYKEPQIEFSYNELDSGIEGGDYIYYFKVKRYGGMIVSSSAYYLYRYNKCTKEIDLMQFFAFERGSIKGTRYSEIFWDDDFRFVNDEFIILDY
ncbi:MAG TPA: hypothetical protein GXZ35_04895 [Acholeplasmataceae bacterium]|nr:hypothetical protein [Acholeplasmataceae bacterium]